MCGQSRKRLWAWVRFSMTLKLQRCCWFLKFTSFGVYEYTILDSVSGLEVTAFWNYSRFTSFGTFEHNFTMFVCVRELWTALKTIKVLLALSFERVEGVTGARRFQNLLQLVNNFEGQVFVKGSRIWDCRKHWEIRESVRMFFQGSGRKGNAMQRVSWTVFSTCYALTTKRSWNKHPAQQLCFKS